MTGEDPVRCRMICSACSGIRCLFRPTSLGHDRSPWTLLSFWTGWRIDVRTRTVGLMALLAVLLLGHPASHVRGADTLLTVAEKSDYRATSRHAEVVDFCERLAHMSPLVRL